MGRGKRFPGPPQSVPWGYAHVFMPARKECRWHLMCRELVRTYGPIVSYRLGPREWWGGGAFVCR
jgi:hypothetical protein